jgi:O-antigen/teichoic acid export membrane protein
MVPILIGGLIFSKDIITFVYTQEYLSALNVFNILLIYLFIFYFRELYGYILVTSGNQKKYLQIIVFSSTINFLLNLTLIPIYGIEGAALTTLVSELINFVAMRKKSHDLINFDLRIKSYKDVLLSWIIVLVLSIVLYQSSLHVILSILLIALIYFSIIYIFNVFEFKNLVKGINVEIS